MENPKNRQIKPRVLAIFEIGMGYYRIGSIFLCRFHGSLRIWTTGNNRKRTAWDFLSKQFFSPVGRVRPVLSSKHFYVGVSKFSPSDAVSALVVSDSGYAPPALGAVSPIQPENFAAGRSRALRVPSGPQLLHSWLTPGVPQS